MKLRIKIAVGVSAGFVWGMLTWAMPWALVVLALGYPVLTFCHAGGVIR